MRDGGAGDDRDRRQGVLVEAHGRDNNVRDDEEVD
jgi:hypothetical protein